MNALTITHSPAEGTLIDGTEKGDGSAQVLKSHGWRWGRSIGAWFVPFSRDKTPKRHIVTTTTAALEAVGFVVTVVLDVTEPDPAEVEARKVQRETDRAEALTAKSQRKQATAEQVRERADAAHEALPPMGEPIKVGHHSEGRHRRAHERAWSTMGQAIEADREAEQVAQRAETAARATQHRHSPVTVANRVKKLEAEVRKIERDLAGGPQWRRNGEGYRLEHVQPTGERRQQLEAQRKGRSADLEFWRNVRAEQIEAGQATNYGPETVAKGDAVKIRGDWRRVVRANVKSVTVETGYSWTDRTPWHEVADHRAAAK